MPLGLGLSVPMAAGRITSPDMGTGVIWIGATDAFHMVPLVAIKRRMTGIDVPPEG